VGSHNFKIGTATALKLIPAIVNLEPACITGVVAFVIDNAESFKVVTRVHA
jgi:hypothetical protein